MKTKKPAVEKLTIGLYLGDRQHHACVLDASGEILAEEVIVNTREVLTAFCARCPDATVVMETGIQLPTSSLFPLFRVSGSTPTAGSERPYRSRRIGLVMNVRFEPEARNPGTSSRGMGASPGFPALEFQLLRTSA